MYQFKVYAVNLSSVVFVIHSSADDAERSLCTRPVAMGSC